MRASTIIVEGFAAAALITPSSVTNVDSTSPSLRFPFDVGTAGFGRTPCRHPARSRSAAFPTHRAESFGEPERRRAVAVAAVCSTAFRLPIERSAMLTDFLTDVRSSIDARSTRTRPWAKASSSASLSWRARLQRRAKAPRLTNSLRWPDHCSTLRHACGARSNRWKHTVSQIAQLSKSRHHRSICAEVTRAGSSTIDATMRASYQPVSAFDVAPASRRVRLSA
jgi:hypothetical protein